MPGGNVPGDNGPSTVSGQGAAGRILKKGVVVEVIYDPTLYGPEMQEKIKGTLNLKNADLLPTAPRNSCIIREFGQGAGSKDQTLLVYPFFPAHLCLPVKPGECVWLISTSADALDPKESFWISRITASSQAEDLNYSHLSRKDPVVPPTSAQIPPYILPDFPNSGASPIILTPPTGSEGSKPKIPPENTFNLIVESSEAYKNFTPQPVPRFSKRIGDFVIQGSNNTLISLGEDRGWVYTDSKIESRGESNASTPASEYAGSIDIVAGRSRYIPANPAPPANLTTAELKGSDPIGTGFPVTTNTRDYAENNKNPTINKFPKPPPAEGDPDFRIDAARIYVSMKTSGDLNFGINQDLQPAIPYIAAVPPEFTPGIPADDALMIPATPSIPKGIAVQSLPGGSTDRMATGFDAKIESIAEASFIVAKADELRLIARKQDADIANDVPEINGSIRIIKEGKNNDDLAIVALLPDGTIQISGLKIYLGRPGGLTALTQHGTPAGDGGRGVGPGPGGSEPYVRYSDLKTLWDSFMDDFSDFLQGCMDNKTPGYGMPEQFILKAATKLKATIASTHKPDISTVQSERIFGE
jgi:hypothetical protein